MIKLIASDLDGTLLLPAGSQELPEGTCELIRKVRSRGIRFVAASGRQYHNLRTLFEPVEDEIDYICENGSLCVCHGEVIFQKEMERALAMRIAEDILSVPSFELLVSCPDVQYLIPKSQDFFVHMRDTVRVRVEAVSEVSRIPSPILKVSAYDPGGLSDLPLWKERYGDLCCVQTSGPQWLDLIPHGINKGVALKKLCTHLGIDPSECIAFGDNDNDRQMLGFVGHPVTMLSSIPSVIGLGETTTDTVNHYLERLLESSQVKLH